jgi:hypothetical protein
LDELLGLMSGVVIDGSLEPLNPSFVHLPCFVQVPVSFDISGNFESALDLVCRG